MEWIRRILAGGACNTAIGGLAGSLGFCTGVLSADRCCSTRVDDLVKKGIVALMSLDRTEVSKLLTKLVIFLKGLRRRTGDAKSSSSSASSTSAISGFPLLGERGINDFSLHF